LSEDKDQFTLWVISGIVGIVVRDIYNLGLKLIPLKNVIVAPFSLPPIIFVAGIKVMEMKELENK
jgi:hypothetical protein